MDILKFKVDRKNIQKVIFNDININIFNIINLIDLLNLIGINEFNGETNKEFKEYIENNCNADEFVLLHMISEYYNKNFFDIKRCDIIPTIVLIFKEKIKNIINPNSSDLLVISEINITNLNIFSDLNYKNIKYEFPTKNIINVTTNSIKKDNEYYGYELPQLNLDKNIDSIVISGDDQYESEIIRVYYKKLNFDVINLSENNNIYYYYKNFKKQDKYQFLDYKIYDLEHLRNVLNLFQPYEFKNLDINKIGNLILEGDDSVFNNTLLIELTGQKYNDVLYGIINIIEKSTHDIYEFSQSVRTFLALAHFSDKNNIEPFMIYINFLNILNSGLQQLKMNYSRVIIPYKNNIIKKYISFIQSFDINENIKNDVMVKLSKEIEIIDNKEIDLEFGIRDLCHKLNTDINFWESIFNIKSNLKTDYSDESIRKIYNIINGQNESIDINTYDISNNILTLVSITYKFIRNFVNSNFWTINNIFIELFIKKLIDIEEFYIENINNINSNAITRITTLVSATYFILIRYYSENNQDNVLNILNLFIKHIEILLDSGVTHQYAGATKKILEDLANIQLIINKYDFKINLEYLMRKTYYRLNTQMNMLFDLKNTLYNRMRPCKYDEYVFLTEHAYATLGVYGHDHKSIVELYNKNTNALDFRYIPVRGFLEYSTMFKSIDDIRFKNSSDEYYLDIVKNQTNFGSVY